MLGLSAEDVIASLPEGFTETKGTARIMPVEGAGGTGQDDSGKTGTMSFSRKTSAHDPYCGAALRLIPEKASKRAEYRKFLLPRTIVQYTSPYPAAVSVDLGDAAEEIRCIVPRGDHYLGLLPKFSQEWLSKIGQGGGADQVVRASAVWSRMRSEDLKAGSNLFVSSIYHYPKDDFFPLFVSLVNPLDPKIPAVADGTAGGAVERWVEGLLLKRLFPRGGSGKLLPGENGRGWVLMRPLSQVTGAKDASLMEVAVLLASMAMRDGIPCWFAIFPETVFLFLGGDPGADGSYAFSIERYLAGAGDGGVYGLMSDSRSHYLGEATSKGEPKFVDAGDCRLFHPLPPPKVETPKGGGAKKTKGDVSANPFDSPR